MAAKISFKVYDTVSVVTFTGYDESAIEAFKKAVPYAGRKWVKAGKYWTVFPAYSRSAAIAMQKFYGSVAAVEIIDLRTKKQQSSKPAAAKPSGSWAESMFAALPPALAEKAYKKLSQALHPDVGGDTTSFQVMEAAYSKIKKQAA